VATEGDDARASVYADLHGDQLVKQEEANRASAHLILSLLFEHFRPRSVLDVGCGIGTWLSVVQELGVKDIAGVDGEWLDRKLARISPARIQSIDLEKGFDLGRRFDLAVCLEVAEHLSADAAEGFVGSLTRHADVVLFSAAIPMQGGHHHVNEQFPEYWEKMFEAAGYAVVDFLRPQIWYCDNVLPWLRQNVMVFAKQELTEGKGAFAGVQAGSQPLSLVHPEMYVERLKSAEFALDEHAKLVELLLAGKTISAVRNPDGKLTLQIKDRGN
jgi:SAM-dependent methyltransferase